MNMMTKPPAPLRLTCLERRVLDALFAAPRGEPMSRADLAKAAEAEGGSPESNLVEVVVSRTRRKLEKAGVPGAILTTYGRGYFLDPNKAEAVRAACPVGMALARLDELEAFRRMLARMATREEAPEADLDSHVEALDTAIHMARGLAPQAEG